MFKKKIKLFSLFGFEVGIDWSWLIIAVLVVWSLSSGLFPAMQEGLSNRTYWFMGIIGALGLFLSIIFHEFCHSVVARNYGLPMKGITLFIFGGVAEMSHEPERPKVEILMAAAGPAASLVVGIIFYALYWTGRRSGWAPPILGLTEYLGGINLLVAGFNLVPAFPLDGGRILRAGLWAWKNDFEWATRITSRIGSGFGILLIFLGILNMLGGNFVGGMWWLLIGLFLRGLAQTSEQRLLIAKALEGEPLDRFIKKENVAVAPSTSVTKLVDQYMYRQHQQLFPIVDGESLLGCVTKEDVKETPRAEWERKTVGELAHSCSPDNTIGPEARAMDAIKAMNQNGLGRLMVVDADGKLRGMVAMSDMLEYVALKSELQG